MATVVRGKKISFPVTPKTRQSGRFLHLVRPQIAVVALTLAASVWALVSLQMDLMDHTLAGVGTNLAWGLYNCAAMATMIRAALWQPAQSERQFA